MNALIFVIDVEVWGERRGEGGEGMGRGSLCRRKLEAELAAVKSRLKAQQSQQSLLLRAFGNTTSLFDETPVKELVPLLRVAHDARANAAAEAIAKAICSTNGRAEKMGGAWALTLRYLPDGDRTSCCIKQVVQHWRPWSQLATLKGELDFPTMYRLLTKLPQDRQTASATQTTEFMVGNLNNLPEELAAPGFPGKGSANQGAF